MSDNSNYAFGRLAGPQPGQAFQVFFEFLLETLPLFPLHHKKFHRTVEHENGITQFLSIFLSRKASLYPFFFQPETLEDPESGNSPSIDIGVFYQSGPEVAFYKIEAKRLYFPQDRLREKEYLVGHIKRNGRYVACGGIERFKIGKHGINLSRCGMLGYIQMDSPEVWENKINNWIESLSREERTPPWSTNERIQRVTIGQNFSLFKSQHVRNSGNIELDHFWINFVSD